MSGTRHEPFEKPVDGMIGNGPILVLVPLYPLPTANLFSVGAVPKVIRQSSIPYLLNTPDS